jgi:hypothetical protein
MANNRLFLVFKPSGHAVYLGKRMAFGWYDTPDDLSERIKALFEKVEEACSDNGEFSQDDFAVALEVEPDLPSPHIIHDWEFLDRCDTSLFVTKLVLRGAKKGSVKC